MRLFIACVAAGVLGAATVLALDNNASRFDPGATAATTAPTPTGRTLEDVRRAYSAPERSMSARASAERVPAPPPLRIVEANVFAITDQQGNVRADIGASGGGSGGGGGAGGGGETKIQLFDVKGNARLVIAEKDGVTTVTMLADEGHEGLTLRLTPGGAAQVTLGTPDARQTAGVSLRSDPSGGPVLSMRGAGGEEAARFSVHADEGGILELHSAKANTQLQPGSLQLTTPKGGPFAGLAIANNNFVSLQMMGGAGSESRTELTCTANSSGMHLQGADRSGANLSIQEEGSFFSIKPQGGKGGLSVQSGVQNDKPYASLFLSDIDGLQKVHIAVRDGLPSLRLVGGEQGTPALFSAP